MTTDEIIAELERQFLFLDQNRSALLDAAAGDAVSMDAVETAWEQSHENLQAMNGKVLAQDTQALQDLVGQLQTTQTQIEASLADLQQAGNIIGSITGVIGQITQAVALGTKLVAMV